MARTRGRAPRLRKSWSNMLPADRVAVTTVQGVIGSVSVPEGAIASPTLLRSRGNLLVWAEPDAASDSDVFAFGLIVVHTNALAVGTTSLPGPIADTGADWLWYQFVPLDAGAATGVTGDSLLLSSWIDLDSKAMRRVPEDHAVVLMGEALTGDFSAGLVSGGVRFLFGS